MDDGPADLRVGTSWRPVTPGEADCVVRPPAMRRAAFATRVWATGCELRPDFVRHDLILILTANDGIRGISPATRVAASRRFAALAI